MGLESSRGRAASRKQPGESGGHCHPGGPHGWAHGVKVTLAWAGLELRDLTLWIWRAKKGFVY